MPLRAITEAIGAGLALPVETITSEEEASYFGWLERLGQIDLAASSTETRRALGGQPVGPDLMTDLRAMNYKTV